MENLSLYAGAGAGAGGQQRIYSQGTHLVRFGKLLL